MKRAETGKGLLRIVSAHLRSMLTKSSLIRSKSQNTLLGQVKVGNISSAFNSFTSFCSSYEHETAINYLLQTIQVLTQNLEEIIQSKNCPQKYYSEVASAIYAVKENVCPELNEFIKNILVSSWAKGEVEKIQSSVTIPQVLSHMKRSNEFTLEELHSFAQEFERNSLMKMNMTWFYENYPINSQNQPEQVVMVRSFGKPLSSNKTNDIKETKSHEDLSKMAMFCRNVCDSDYEIIDTYVTSTIQRWNLMNQGSLIF